jgi:hypothetical protein
VKEVFVCGGVRRGAGECLDAEQAFGHPDADVDGPVILDREAPFALCQAACSDAGQVAVDLLERDSGTLRTG